MALRDNPYGQFNFMVKLGDAGGEDQIVGGFSDASGFGNEVKYSECCLSQGHHSSSGGGLGEA